jgi:endonuclease YncB( thermonuclease family)
MIAAAAPALSFSCECVGVTDGDTITVLGEEGANTVHLYGIDAPELSQIFGKWAEWFLSDLVYKKVIQIKPEEADRYGCIMGVVFVNGINVNREIVKFGLAWVDRKYCEKPFCAEWLELEDAARKAGIGLWSKAEPLTPPWVYRSNRR